MRSYPARLLIGFLLLLTGSLAHAGSRPSVVFLSPDDSRFWQLVAGFMEAVAEDLEVDLEVQYDPESHRYSYLRMAKDVLSREEKPDYLLFMCKENVTEPMLRLADGAGVKTFTFNTDVPDAARASIGMPRTVLPSWLGHLSPDNHCRRPCPGNAAGQTGRTIGPRIRAQHPYGGPLGNTGFLRRQG